MHCYRLLAAALLVVATGIAAPADAGELEEALLAVEGRFEWHAERQDFIFSDRPRLAGLLEPEPEQWLATLVDCIDDERQAGATLGGAPVNLGVMCYQALRLVAYVEAADWAGHIGPQATSAERRAAKQAWRAALDERRYVLH